MKHFGVMVVRKHWLMWLVSAGFVIFFAQDWISSILPK